MEPRGEQATPNQSCILALDLGTSAFKAAPVAGSDLIAEPVVIPCEPDYSNGTVTCPPERYVNAAMSALRAAAACAIKEGFAVTAIGISSQAQTYVALNRVHEPLGDAVVWLDSRASHEAKRLTAEIPDVSAVCGFRAFSGLQFLPKVVHALNSGEIEWAAMRCFALLNEYCVLKLTGKRFGDTTCQGMGGFLEISSRLWSRAALNAAGIGAHNLSPVYPAAMVGAPLSPQVAATLKLDRLPVYLCGNDQCCAAAGVELSGPEDLLCNFGTAMVVYARRDILPETITDSQIAGIDPLTDRYFLLGLENECGNIIDMMARSLFPDGGVEQLLAAAASAPAPSAELIARFASSIVQIANRSIHSDLNTSPDIFARALLEHFAGRFNALLDDLHAQAGGATRVFASGGLSRSDIWLDFMARQRRITFLRADNEHAALLGVARILSSRQVTSV